ncbi:hypothetical protein BH23ACT10_BH23ACT10_27560 [soil metagenome]
MVRGSCRTSARPGRDPDCAFSARFAMVARCGAGPLSAVPGGSATKRVHVNESLRAMFWRRAQSRTASARSGTRDTSSAPVGERRSGSSVRRATLTLRLPSTRSSPTRGLRPVSCIATSCGPTRSATLSNRSCSARIPRPSAGRRTCTGASVRPTRSSCSFRSPRRWTPLPPPVLRTAPCTRARSWSTTADGRSGGPRALLTGFGLVHLLSAVAARPADCRSLDDFLYVAPELLRGATPTARSDQYSLAAALQHAVTGRPPFVRAHLPALCRCPPVRSPSVAAERRRWYAIGARARSRARSGARQGPRAPVRILSGLHAGGR